MCAGESHSDVKYIGETLRSLKTRLAEHQQHTRDQRFDISAVAEHATYNEHDIDTAISSSRWRRNQDRAEALLRVLIKQIAAWICCIARRDRRLDC